MNVINKITRSSNVYIFFLKLACSFREVTHPRALKLV